mgnify:CR=1 FL=1
MNILDIIAKKRDNKKLSKEEIDFFVKEYTNNTIADYQAAALIMAIYINKLDEEETTNLTLAMAHSGDVLDLSEIGTVVDKHSTGGVGDKVTLILAPIIASLGIPVAKMSGRGLGFTGGTIDKLESIPGYTTNVDIETFKRNVKKIGISLIGQTLNLAPADKKIYALRNEIGAVDSIPLIASSIMSKKIASGSDTIVIDLKVGKGAFMTNIKDATKLAKTMVELGRYYNKKVVCTLSDMSVPLGLNIGNALEVKEVIDFFNGKYDKRLYELSVSISSLMISVSKGINISKARKLVINLLECGHAKNKFYEWIKAQGGDIKKLKINAHRKYIYSDSTGYINNIDVHKLSKLVFDLGAGRVHKTDNIDYSVGVVLNKTIGSKVKEKELLATIYYNKKIDDMTETLKECFKIDKRKRKNRKYKKYYII